MRVRPETVDHLSSASELLIRTATRSTPRSKASPGGVSPCRALVTSRSSARSKGWKLTSERSTPALLHVSADERASRLLEHVPSLGLAIVEILPCSRSDRRVPQGTQDVPPAG